MFKNEFQGGSYFEVFSAQSKDAASVWKQSGSGTKKDFDKDVRSFVYVVEGSAATTKIQIPKDAKHALTLIQRYLVLQLCVPKGLDFSIDLGVSDLANQKIRLVLSTTYKEIQTNPLHSKVPLGFIKRSKWLNLCLDMVALVSDTWHGQTYKCVDSICIAGNCRLRRIFTMKQQPLDTTDDEEVYGFTGTNNGIENDRIPKHCQLAPDISQDVQVVTMTKVQHYEGRGRVSEHAENRGRTGEPLTSRTSSQVDLDLSSSGGKRSADNYHIAFGTKMSGAGQPRKGSGKDGSVTSRQHNRSSHNRSKSDASAESFRASDSLTGDTVEDNGLFVKPHPPRQPSSEKRRRPRVKSAGKERTQHLISKDDSSSAYSSLNSSRGTSQSRSNSGNQSSRQDRTAPTYVQPNRVANDDEIEQIMLEMQRSVQHDPSKSETESEISSHDASDIRESDSLDQDSLSEVIKALQGQQLDDNSQEYEDSDGDPGEMEEDEAPKRREKSESLYTFASRPKHVPRGHNMQNSGQFERSFTRPRQRKRSDQSHRKHSHSRRKPDAPPGGNTSSVTNSSDEEDTEMTPRPSNNTQHKHTSSPPRPKMDISPQQRVLRQPPHGNPRQAPPPQIDTGHHPAFRNNGLLQIAPQMTKSPHSSQTRMSINRKSLREISTEELRKSVSQPPYNVTKYQPHDQPRQVAVVTDSFEQKMLASLQREMLEAGTSEEDEKKTSKLHQYDTESLSGSSDEGESTLKGVPTAHNYQDEMRILSQEFLTQSNPRDWGNVFSPPIAQATKTDTSDLAPAKQDGRVREGGIDSDELLDLLYDPVLNCYYDPVSCKYYELV